MFEQEVEKHGLSARLKASLAMRPVQSQLASPWTSLRPEVQEYEASRACAAALHLLPSAARTDGRSVRRLAFSHALPAVPNRIPWAH